MLILCHTPHFLFLTTSIWLVFSGNIMIMITIIKRIIITIIFIMLMTEPLSRMNQYKQNCDFKQQKFITSGQKDFFVLFWVARNEGTHTQKGQWSFYSGRRASILRIIKIKIFAYAQFTFFIYIHFLLPFKLDLRWK